MVRFTRLLSAAAAAIMLFGSGIQASAAGGTFEASVQPDCVVAGQPLNISVPHLVPGTLVSVRVTYSDSAPGGGTQSAIGHAGTQGLFTATMTIPSTASPGSGSVAILIAGSGEAEIGTGGFRIATGTGTGICPSPGTGTIVGSGTSRAFSYRVVKTCDAGVSGNAVFAMFVTMTGLGRFDYPAVTLACNGEAVALPAIPQYASTITLRETVRPAGAAAAANVTFSLPPASDPITIHNARAASTTTLPPQLAGTGGGSPPKPVPLSLALGLLAVLLLAVASIPRSSRSR